MRSGLLASILGLALRALEILLWILAFLALIASLLLIAASFGVSVPQVNAEALSTPLAFMAAAIMIITIAAALIVVGRLRRIFKTVAEGDPFIEDNAQRLRVIWITLAAWELTRYALGGLAAVLAYVSDAPRWENAFRLDSALILWFAVLVIMVLAEVFREGARLRAEQKLTI